MLFNKKFTLQVIDSKTLLRFATLKSRVIPKIGTKILDADKYKYYEVLDVIYPFFNKECGQIIDLHVKLVDIKEILKN